MKGTASDFISKSREKSEDRVHRKTINFNIGKYNAVVPQGKQQFAELHLARERAKNIKWRAIETLDSQLETFEAAISKRGANVMWAEDAQEALDIILKVCQENNLSQEQVKLSLSGLIEKQSVLFKELYQYFIHVEFRNAGWQLPGNEYPAHFFTSLNDLARCAS